MSHLDPPMLRIPMFLINDVMDNNNNNNLFTYIAPFNIYGMIKGALQSKKTNITIDNYNKNAIYNR